MLHDHKIGLALHLSALLPIVEVHDHDDRDEDDVEEDEDDKLPHDHRATLLVIFSVIIIL